MTRLQKFINQIVWFWSGITWKGKFIGTAIRDWFVDAYIRFVVGAMEKMEVDWLAKLAPMLKKAEDTEAVPPELQPILDEMKKPGSFIGAGLMGMAGSTAAGGLISSTIGPWLLLLQYQIQRLAKQFRLPLGSIIEAMRRGITQFGDVKSDYLDQGLTEDRFNLLFEVSKLLLATGELQELLRRGEIDPDEFKARMLKLGYDEKDIPELEKLKDIIPPLPDMTRFADFGSFDPHIIALWREYYDAPGWISEPMAKIGISNEPPNDWANKYWFSHWRQPGRFELGELHRRFLLDPGARSRFEAGDTGADAAQDELVKNAYLTQGFSAFWQGLLLKLVEQPLTRVDVRRMHKLGLLTDVELSVAYRAVGYYGENNAKMVEFTKAYNSRTTTEADRDLTKSDILRLFADRVIGEVEAHDMLLELDYDEDEIAYLLDLYTRETALKTHDLTLSQVKELYQLGMRTKAQVTQFLEAFGYDKDEILALYELWDWTKPLKVSRPTRTQLDKFLGEGIITVETWSAEYTALGYEMRYQEWYFALMIESGEYPPGGD